MAIVESASTDVLLEREEPLARSAQALAGAAAGHGTAGARRRGGGGREDVPRPPASATSCPSGTARLLGGVRPARRHRARSGRSSRSPSARGIELAEPSTRGAPRTTSQPRLLELSSTSGSARRRASRMRTGRTRARWTSCGCSVGGSPTTPSLVLVTYRDDELGARHPLRIALGDLATAAARRARSRRATLPRRRRPARQGRATSTSSIVWRLTSGNPFYVTRAPRARAARRYPDTVRDAGAGAGRAARPAGDGRRRGGGGRSTVARRSAAARGVRRGSRLRGRVPRERRSPCRRTAASRSVTSSHARRVEESLVAGTSARAASLGAVRRSRTRPVGTPTSRASRTTPRRPATRTQCCATHRPRPSRRRARARTARRRPSTRAPSASAATCAPGERAELLEGRSRACYLADDQTEAIEVIREAIRCRQAQGTPLEEARALTELTDYLWCRGYIRRGGARPSSVRRNSLRGIPSNGSTRTCFHTQALRALYGGDVDECFELARRAVAVGERFGDDHDRRPCARHDRQRNRTQRPRAWPAPDRGGRPGRTAKRRARGRRTRHERTSSTVPCRGTATTSSSGTSTMRSSTAPSTRRTCGGSTSRRSQPAGPSIAVAGTTRPGMPARS